MVAGGQEIYHSPLELKQALQRIEHYYFPYHLQLRQLIDQMIDQFQIAYVIDCHSMPSLINHSLANHTPTKYRQKNSPDIVLGDQFGKSCHGDLMVQLDVLLQKQRFCTAQNKPYAGGYITEHYGQPDQSVHVIQIEINRALYMDEQIIEKKSTFSPLKNRLQKVFLQLIGVFHSNQAASSPLAAE